MAICRRAPAAVLLACAIAACGHDDTCPMETLSGIWTFAHVVTSATGDPGHCTDYTETAEVSGLFGNDSWTSDDGYHSSSSSISPPDCHFVHTESSTAPRAGSTTTTLELMQQSPTTLVGTASYATTGLWGAWTCTYDVTVTEQGAVASVQPADGPG